MVDLPEAERPVNQRVRPCCLRRALRSGRVREGCQVMFLEKVKLVGYTFKEYRDWGEVGN